MKLILKIIWGYKIKSFSFHMLFFSLLLLSLGGSYPHFYLTSVCFLWNKQINPSSFEVQRMLFALGFGNAEDLTFLTADIRSQVDI
jgi:hypothetical protein